MEYILPVLLYPVAEILISAFVGFLLLSAAAKNENRKKVLKRIAIITGCCAAFWVASGFAAAIITSAINQQPLWSM